MTYSQAFRPLVSITAKVAGLPGARLLSPAIGTMSSPVQSTTVAPSSSAAVCSPVPTPTILSPPSNRSASSRSPMTGSRVWIVALTKSSGPVTSARAARADFWAILGDVMHPPSAPEPSATSVELSGVQRTLATRDVGV
jgi:hypothetical protein